MSEVKQARESATRTESISRRQRRWARGRLLADRVWEAPQGIPHQPVHPGRFLQTRFLTPLGISQSDLAGALGVSRRRINELLRGHRGITADTALRLGVFFDMDPHFWLGLQASWDLYQVAKRREQDEGEGPS